MSTKANQIGGGLVPSSALKGRGTGYQSQPTAYSGNRNGNHSGTESPTGTREESERDRYGSGNYGGQFPVREPKFGRAEEHRDRVRKATAPPSSTLDGVETCTGADTGFSDAPAPSTLGFSSPAALPAERVSVAGIVVNDPPVSDPQSGCRPDTSVTLPLFRNDSATNGATVPSGVPNPTADRAEWHTAPESAAHRNSRLSDAEQQATEADHVAAALAGDLDADPSGTLPFTPGREEATEVDQRTRAAHRARIERAIAGFFERQRGRRK